MVLFPLALVLTAPAKRQGSKSCSTQGRLHWTLFEKFFDTTGGARFEQLGERDDTVEPDSTADTQPVGWQKTSVTVGKDNSASFCRIRR